MEESPASNDTKLDPVIAIWILDYALRQPVPDKVINKFLHTEAFPIHLIDVKLRKGIVLRTVESEIASGSVSEKTLDCLELLEKLDRATGIPANESMLEAYCAVAVNCTVKFISCTSRMALEGGKADYFEAVNRIWGSRVSKLNGGGDGECSLIGDEYDSWRNEVEAAVVDPAAEKRLLARSAEIDAVKLVRRCLKEAWEAIGPSFLELQATKQMITRKDTVGNVSLEKEIDVDSTQRPDLGASDATVGEEDGNNGNPKSANELPLEVNGSNNSTMNSCGDVHLGVKGCADDSQAVNLPNLEVRTARNAVQKNRVKHVACHRRVLRAGSKIVNTEDDDTSPRSSKYDILSSVEVNKAKAALRLSSNELHFAVQDPLPDALRTAEDVAAAMLQKPLNTRASAAKDAGIPETCHDASTAGEARPPDERTPNPSQATAPKRSIMERNETARVFEWEDSIDDSHGERCDGLQKRGDEHVKGVTPLKRYDLTRFVRRRQVKRWSVEEENALRDAVERFGKGNWKLILNSRRDVFIERTEVDLKDKWRNMTK